MAYVTGDVKPRKRHQGRHYLGETDVGGDNVKFSTTASSTTSLWTTAANIRLSELEAIGIVMTAVGRTAGGSGEHYYGRLAGLFKRESGGNVTWVGSGTTMTAINGGTWKGLGLVANTPAQTVDVQVGTSGSDTASWRVDVEYQKVRTST